MNDQSRDLVHAVTGPIILITVGSLFALDKFSGYPFRQTWPVLIIVIGFLKLFGGGSRRSRKYAPVPQLGGPLYTTPPPRQAYGPSGNQYVPPAPPYAQPGPAAPHPASGAGFAGQHYDPAAPPPPPTPGVRR